MRIGNMFWIAGISCLYFSFLQLFWGEGAPVQILPVAGYAVYMLATGEKHAIYWEKIRIFKVHAVVLVVELFAGLVMEKDLKMVLIYMVAYLLFSVMALNLFRYGKSLDGTGRFLYALHLGLYVLVCGAFAGVLSFLGRMGGRIIEIILTPFAYLLAGVVSLGTGLTQLLRNGAEKMAEQVMSTEEVAEQAQQSQQIEQAAGNVAETTWLDMVFRTLPVILLVLFLGYAVYKIYCWYKERYVYREDEVKIAETYEKVGKKGFGRIKLFKTNREKIRKEYVKYMRSVRVQGYRIGKSSTSLDICNEANQRLNRENAENERIRELYMKARYSEEAVSDEEVREMKELL